MLKRASEAEQNDSQQPLLIRAEVIWIVLTTSAVALRLLARRVSGAGLWYDDYAILVAMLFAWALVILVFIGKDCTSGPGVTSADLIGFQRCALALVDMPQMHPQMPSRSGACFSTSTRTFTLQHSRRSRPRFFSSTFAFSAEMSLLGEPCMGLEPSSFCGGSFASSLPFSNVFRSTLSGLQHPGMCTDHDASMSEHTLWARPASI